MSALQFDAVNTPDGSSTSRIGPVAVSGANPLPSYAPGGLRTPSATFTRPADTTAYASGDLVANSTSAAVALQIAGCARAAGEAVRIERIRVRKSAASLTNASFRIHLFRGDPTLTVNDNAVFNNSNLFACAIAKHVGEFSVTMDRSGSDGAKGIAVPSVGNGVNVVPDDGSTLFVLIEATAAYTPASGETFSVTLEGACA